MIKALRSLVLILPVALASQWSTAQSLSPAAGIYNTVAGTGINNYFGNGGLAISADLDYPEGAAVDASGNLYIADTYNFVVRKVSASSGIITTVAGNHTEGYSGDGGLATNAMLSYPDSIAVDSSGNLYIADSVNNRIRKVTASSGIITTVAGNGTAGYSGDGGQATSAEIDEPQGVAVDSSGNLYILDTLNYRIRKVQASTSAITTVAGDGIQGYSGDGEQATNAEINPGGIAVDASANLYIADSGNDRVRKVTAFTGIISTVAGDGTAGYSGDGELATSAEINDPSSVAVDAVGNLYIADNSNHRIRKVMSSTGDITTVAGIGATGLHGKCAASGLGGLATNAEICYFTGIAVDSAGDFYLAGGYGASEVYGIGAVRTSPTITWARAAAITDGTALSGTQLDATANTAGTFVYTPSSGTVLGVGSQTLSVLFTPTDTLDYTTATASATLQVNKVTPNVSVFCSPNPITYGGANSICTISVSNGSTGTVTLAINGSAWTEVNLSSSSANAQFPSTYGIGAFTVGATYNGDGNNNSANGSGSVTVSQVSQSISFTAPASPVSYGVAPITLSATGGTSGNPVVFSIVFGPGSISGSTLTITGAGTVMVAANQAGNTDYSAAATVFHSIVINAAVLTVTAKNASRAYGAANPTFTVSISGFVNGDTSSVLSGAPSLTTTATSTSAPGSYAITAAVGTLVASNYTFSFVNGTLTVTAATQTISFTAPASPVTYGVSPISLSATTSSGLAVTFSVSSGPCSVSGSALTVTGAGTCVVAANQPGNADYTAAAAVMQSLVINKESVNVSSTSSLSPSIYGDNVVLTFTLTGSGVTPTGSVTIDDGASTLATISLNAGIATYNTSVLIAGKHTLTAVYSGDNNYQ